MAGKDIELTIIVSTLVILLLICGVIITMFIANKRHVLQEVKIARMEANYEKELRQAEQEVQEKVLANVARDLHDNLGQRMTVIKLHVERHKLQHPDIKAELEHTTKDIDDTIQELRQISRSLNSELLENGGILQAMEAELERVRKLNTYSVQWTADKEPILTKDQRVMLFRIFQETMNNILKHAGGKNIDVRMQSTNGLYLTISDDGKGFDKDEKINSGKGSGLQNMIKRAGMAGMECSIESNTGNGTTLTIKQTA